MMYIYKIIKIFVILVLMKTRCTATTDEELKKITGGSKKGLVIMDEIEKLKLNDEFNAWYNAEKVEEKCRNSAYFEGTNNGIIVGEKNKQLEVAKLMLNNNEDLDKISKYTGLTISELEDLFNN